METKDIPTTHLQLWLPEPDPLIHQVIGKLGEESAELSAMCFRILIQGFEGKDPKTGKSNQKALEDEIADVEALMKHAKHYAHLNKLLIQRRKRAKFLLKLDWFQQILTHLGATDA